METHSKFGWNRGWVTVLSRKPAICLKWGKIEPRLLLTTTTTTIRMYTGFIKHIFYFLRAV